MLFTAYERTAYAELLAAAWIPLLLHAILRKRVTVTSIAIPVALLWLTNAPAAVMSCYALALIAAIRLLQPANGHISKARFALNTSGGTLLGLGLTAFYIVPAAYQRRFVQIAMAIIPPMRIQDNFLFHHTGDIAHDQVLHTASLVAILLIALTAATFVMIRVAAKARNPQLSTHLLPPIAVLTVAITLLLTPVAAPIWNHAPELAFLQFPWRLLAILAAILSLTTALALTALKLRARSAAAVALVIATALTYPAYSVFRQSCDPEDTVQARQALFHSSYGDEPTDEYTPITADNDSLAHTNPPFWLSSDPNAKAPANATPSPVPTHFTISSLTPQTLILNLRDYPTWRITLNQTLITARQQRDDGLIALPIPAGPSTITLGYAHTPDQTIGNGFTLASLALLLAIFFRRNQSQPSSHLPRPRTSTAAH